jgi:hypothetical protein
VWRGPAGDGIEAFPQLAAQPIRIDSEAVANLNQ